MTILKILGVKVLKTYKQLPKRRWKGQIPSFHKVRRYLPSAMKRRIILVLILALVLSTTIGYAYASKVVEDIHKEIEKLQYAGIFEDIGKAIGEAVDDTISSVTKAIGETLEELIKYTVNKFKDVKVSDWFIETVSKLIGRGGIDGYPDGTFRPNNTITRAEFTKILVSTLGHENLPKTGSHWASGYITKAEEIKLIGKGELKEIDKPITRNEMAKMAANALDYLGESHVSDRNLFRSQIKDFDKIPKAYQDYVLKAYSKGIITGYPDGTFKGDRGLTRAEASTVIIRVIEKDERKAPTKPEMPTESGPNVDLRKVPIVGEGMVDIRVKGDYNPNNIDFSYMVRMYKPVDNQYKDIENLLIARFGKDNSSVKEILSYLKSSDNLPGKTWTINGQLVWVASGYQTKEVTVWRAK